MTDDGAPLCDAEPCRAGWRKLMPLADATEHAGTSCLAHQLLVKRRAPGEVPASGTE